MNAFRFITVSLRHYRRVHIAVAMGVAVATSVLTGALLVGDSVRGSLRDLTLERLGRIDSALVAGHMFRADLVGELAANTEFKRHFATAEPAILMSGTLQSGSGKESRRATAISIIGIGPGFWSLGAGGPREPLAEDEVAITESLARELGVEVGGEILLRVPTAGAIPADSPLGEKSDTSLARTLKVAAVLPAEGLARFGLMPSQHLPRNAFVSLATLQDVIGEAGKVNAILVASDQRERAAGEDARAALEHALRPKLEDYGVQMERIATPNAVTQISAERLVLPNAILQAAGRAFGKEQLQPVVTYLANTITRGEGDSQRKIPYSTITGIDSTKELGPLIDAAGEPILLADDEIVLNRWAADDLQAAIGDMIAVSFYEPESTHGRLKEHEPPPKFKLRAIVELENAEGQPTAAADPKLTPELPGVTDQESINDWELPFELVETIRQTDEDYWDKYKTTPKAFISLATAKRLWPSRWGTISLLRLPADQAARGVANVSDQLLAEIDPAALGMTFLPVKELGLQAASGTTPFDALFLGFSFFLIAAALMLIALLFQLGVDERVRELGTLAAVGVDKKRIAGLLSREGLIVAAIGAIVGIVAGVLYAWLMIAALRTWWVAAIATPFLELHVTWKSLLLGGIAGIVVSWLALRLTIRRLVRQPANNLLRGVTTAEPARLGNSRIKLAVWPMMRGVIVISLVALLAFGYRLQGEAQAGVFFGSGALVLVLLLGEIRYRLRGLAMSSLMRRGLSLSKLSALNTSRNPGRSTLTIGLVASASFLIVAISAFRLDTGESGTGGFKLIGISDQPIHYDLNTPDGRVELGLSDDANRELDQWQVYSLRVAGGEDASCLNLYRPTQPRVLGVPNDLINRGGFAWSATAEEFGENPWSSLDASLGKDERSEPIVPVVLDASTAVYSLHLKGVGSRLTIRDAADQPVRVEVVGLLKNSVLQGNLLMSEANFLRLFPDTGGYRYFLMERNERQIAGPPRGPGTGERGSPAIPSHVDGHRDDTVQLFESSLSDTGFDVVDAREQLAAFLAVQNTYLSTFQGLGALGLLLGTIGLAVVQLRSVLERRGELALMRSGGFPRARLVKMIVWENVVLLVGGLAVGVVAAAVALIPQWAPQDAAVPWFSLAILLGAIAVVGVMAGWLATRSALRAPIVPALRGD